MTSTRVRASTIGGPCATRAGGVALIILLACPASIRPHEVSPKPEAPPPSITLVFQFEAAKRVLALFDHSNISDATIEEVVRLEDIQAIIEQAARFDPRATPQEMKRSLRTAVEGGDLPGDLFQ